MAKMQGRKISKHKLILLSHEFIGLIEFIMLQRSIVDESVHFSGKIDENLLKISVSHVSFAHYQFSFVC